MSEATPAIRELFIDELADVQGGGPVEELIEKLGGNTTYACCEEGPDSCCSDW